MPDPTPADDGRPDAPHVPEAALGDNVRSQTLPDPDSPLRDASAVTLPDAAIGSDAVDRVIEGHTYDGIREYDNPMPGWWIAVFWICVLFAPLYALGVHAFDWIDSYDDDFAEAGARLEAIRAEYAASGPVFEASPAALRAYAEDASLIPAGAEAFASTCASCHAADGGGLIGPNLTDAYWIHDPSPEGIWEAIDQGYPTKGMPPWSDVLGPEEKSGLIAYVTALQGTTPAMPKEPQGERVVGL